MSRSLVLAIETSCDETAVAVLQAPRQILASEIASQIDLHKQYGGVVPEVASRNHLPRIRPLIEVALQGAGFSACADDPSRSGLAGSATGTL